MTNLKKGDCVKFKGVTYRVASRRGDGVVELADKWGKIVDVLPETDARLMPGKESELSANSAVLSANPVVANALAAKRTARLKEKRNSHHEEASSEREEARPQRQEGDELHGQQHTERKQQMASTNPVVRNALAARNAKFIGRPPARVKQLVEGMEKILEVTDPNDTTDRMMGEVMSLGWDWDDTRRAWVYDDSFIRSYVRGACTKFMQEVTRSDLVRAIDNISDKTMASDMKSMIGLARKYAR